MEEQDSRGKVPRLTEQRHCNDSAKELDMERRRAAERNEKTDSVTKERRRVKDLEAKVRELEAEKLEREEKWEDEREEREHLAGLLTDFAEDVGSTAERRLEWGRGLAHRILTDEDLLRAAELIDPDE